MNYANNLRHITIPFYTLLFAFFNFCIPYKRTTHPIWRGKIFLFTSTNIIIYIII